MFDKQFGAAARTRIEAIIAFVDVMYSEEDTLKTEIAVNLVGVEHSSGSDWGIVDDWALRLSPWCYKNSLRPVAGGDLSQIATNSPYDANIYVFLTGDHSKGRLGKANLDSVCDSDRTKRVNINKYAGSNNKGGDAYTAEVMYFPLLVNNGIR